MKQFQFKYVNSIEFRKELKEFKQSYDNYNLHKIIFQIYSELLEKETITELSNIIDEEFPDALYAGCSTNANIVNGDFSETRISVVCTVFEKETTQAKFLQYKFNSDTADAVADTIIAETEKNPWVKAIEMYVTIPEISTTPFCNKLRNLRSDIHIFGGVASSEDVFNPSSLVFSKGGECSNNTIVIMMFGGKDFHVDSMYVTGWQPLGKKFYVTKATGNVLYELDGTPAFDAYYQYLKIENDENFFFNTLEFPLVYEHNDITILRAPLASNPDGSLNMSADIETGSIARIAYANPYTIIQTVKSESKKMRDFIPDVIHIFSCAARRTFWNSDEDAVKELKSFKSISQTSGFFTHGEFLRSKGHLNQHNVTLVVAAMREGEPKNISVIENNYEPPRKKVPMVTRLATFIGVAAKELEESNRKLTELNHELEVVNHKLELMATFDGLTNLYNRSEIQKRIVSCLGHSSEKPFCLMMLDIDNFKRVNDTYGHQVGDTVIIAIADILRNKLEPYAPGTFAGRWGGEEFMVLLPGFKVKRTIDVAEIVRKLFANHSFPSAPSQTVSIGVTQAKPHEDLDTLCTRVDTALYKAKTTGKNKVVVI